MEEDPLTVSFKDTEFLQMFGLNHDNVLDYFKLSPQFYDKRCINESLAMQKRFNSLSDLDHRNMTGIEYARHSYSYNPSLFVINKYYRHSPDKLDLLAVYYIVEGTIYQSPDLFTLLSNRLLTSLHQIKTAFSAVKEEARFQPARPYHWGMEEDLYDEDEDWKVQSANKNMDTDNSMNIDDQMNGVAEVDIDDDIIIEAGGSDEEGHQSIKFQPLAATSLSGVDAGREFTGSLDGLIARMQNAGAAWGTGVGVGLNEPAASVDVRKDAAPAAVSKGLTLEEMKAAAKARTAEFAAANATFKRPEPMDTKTPGASGSSGNAGRAAKKPKRMGSSVAYTPSGSAYTPSTAVGTLDYTGPTKSGNVVPVQSPFEGLVSRRAGSTKSKK
ncbi:hypothetical protein CcCBS67573_g06552 [Chytriomyces confervae]|uniref:Mediator of RNA polymerase II transcription subunit 6 n=1 Tax=Chytriomyces confervae TaxID=246404 RepID=A0A507F4X0_9FUNG|nr:hypothetical protein CcCBS67573_g06552 [Chytriomyces confervae]